MAQGIIEGGHDFSKIRLNGGCSISAVSVLFDGFDSELKSGISEELLDILIGEKS